MPIRFYCKRCHQLLGIASRKAGSEIQCPKCGISQIVPNEEAALAAMVMDQFAKNPETVERAANLVVYDDEPSAIETPRPRRASKQEMTPARPEAPPKQAPIQPGKPIPRGMILYPRRTLYVQAVLFLVLGAVAFGAGYFIGLGNATHERQIAQFKASRQEVTLRGKLFYNPGTGKIALDEDAVIIALPEGRFPEGTIPIQDIRPQAPPPTETHKTVRMIKDLGGAYARADTEGNFIMTVPDQGKYWLLLISAHAARPADSEINEVDLPEMARYFNLAEHLIGRYKYRWSLEEVNVGFNPIEHDFGRDGEE